jgi:uncharacterized DUF497 family protein
MYIRKLVATPIFRIYTYCMNISYDTVKNETNIEKHGVALMAAADYGWEEALIWVDARKNYGEVRMCSIGYIGNRLFYVAYVDRNESRRIISVRSANAREVKRYAEA